MNPIFTLNYPELLVAEYLQSRFAKKSSFSVLIPASGQQKGYDLALLHRAQNGSKAITFQVKSSKTYPGTPGTSRNGLRTFAHNMWLKRFKVPAEADFFVLIGLYTLHPRSEKNTLGLWKPHMLIFTQAEMRSFMESVRQRRLEKPDSHFCFGFDDESEAFLTRGHAEPRHPDFSEHLLPNRLQLIQKAL